VSKEIDRELEAAAERSIHRDMIELHEADARILQFINGAKWQALRQTEALELMREMAEVMERAIQLSKDHPDFKLYGMEPFDDAIKKYRVSRWGKE